MLPAAFFIGAGLFLLFFLLAPPGSSVAIFVTIVLLFSGFPAFFGILFFLVKAGTKKTLHALAGALWTALNAQPDLWRKAMDRNVFIADEQTLFAALRIINLTWTQIAQAQNHEKVYALANEMLDRVGQFMKKYQALGKALDSAAKAYEDGEKKLLPTGQSILQTCA